MQNALTVLSSVLASVVLLAGCAQRQSVRTDEFAIPRAEFAKYHEAVTGRAPAADAVRFAIVPSVSRTGNDAYAIQSDAKGVVLTGSNARSVLYAVYDLLERRASCRRSSSAAVRARASSASTTIGAVTRGIRMTSMVTAPWNSEGKRLDA